MWESDAEAADIKMKAGERDVEVTEVLPKTEKQLLIVKLYSFVAEGCSAGSSSGSAEK